MSLSRTAPHVKFIRYGSSHNLPLEKRYPVCAILQRHILTILEPCPLLVYSNTTTGRDIKLGNECLGSTT